MWNAFVLFTELLGVQDLTIEFGWQFMVVVVEVGH